MSWKSELVRDLGGDPSAQQLTIIELATRVRLYLDAIDGWLMTQPSIINKRRRSAIPILLQRMQLSDALARHLQSLGLQRRLPVQPDLQSYIAEFDRKKAEHADAAPTEPELPTKETDGHAE
jgi:hypothetical protein